MSCQVITVCEDFTTSVTVESLTLMDSSDVPITTSIGCIGGFTKVTVESLTLMDSSDVIIKTSTLCEGGFTKVTAMCFLGFWDEELCFFFFSSLFPFLVSLLF